jgi:hypothetical protein
MYKQRLELERYENRELEKLYELGLEQYEIDYLKHLREKERNKHKWR